MPLPVVETAYRSLLPWFLPGTAVGACVGVVVARPLAAWLHGRPLLAWAIVATLGMIVAATLTPLHGQLDLAASGGTCDLSRIGLAPWRQLLRIDDTSLNILLFVPFGAAIGLVPGRGARLALLAAAIALPFGIELTQLLLPALDRGCQSADIFDNLTGLAVGLAIGTVARLASAPAAFPD